MAANYANRSAITYIVIVATVVFFYLSACEIIYVCNLKSIRMDRFRRNENLELGTKILHYTPIILLITSLSWLINYIWTLIFTVNGSFYPREWSSCATFGFGLSMFGFAIPYFSVLMFFFAKYLALYTSRFGFPKIWPVLLFSFAGFVNFLTFLIYLEFGTRYEETSEGCTLSKDMKFVLTIPMILTFALFITLHFILFYWYVLFFKLVKKEMKWSSQASKLRSIIVRNLAAGAIILISNLTVYLLLYFTPFSITFNVAAMCTDRIFNNFCMILCFPDWKQLLDLRPSCCTSTDVYTLPAKTSGHRLRAQKKKDTEEDIVELSAKTTGVEKPQAEQTTAREDLFNRITAAETFFEQAYAGHTAESEFEQAYAINSSFEFNSTAATTIPALHSASFE